MGRLIDALRTELKATRGERVSQFDIVFTEPPSPGNECDFIEVEDSKGKSVSIGEWISRPDGSTALRIRAVAPVSAMSAADKATERGAKNAAWDASGAGKAAQTACDAWDASDAGKAALSALAAAEDALDAALDAARDVAWSGAGDAARDAACTAAWVAHDVARAASDAYYAARAAYLAKTATPETP